jgi:hypothetical protein
MAAIESKVSSAAKPNWRVVMVKTAAPNDCKISAMF